MFIDTDIIITILIILALSLFVYFAIQAILTITMLRRILHRIEMLTDFKWLINILLTKINKNKEDV